MPFTKMNGTTRLEVSRRDWVFEKPVVVALQPSDVSRQQHRLAAPALHPFRLSRRG